MPEVALGLSIMAFLFSLVVLVFMILLLRS